MSLIRWCNINFLQALKDAGFSASDIDEIVLVGGSTRVPKVRELVKEIFGKEPHDQRQRNGLLMCLRLGIVQGHGLKGGTLYSAQCNNPTV